MMRSLVKGRIHIAAPAVGMADRLVAREPAARHHQQPGWNAGVVPAGPGHARGERAEAYAGGHGAGGRAQVRRRTDRQIGPSAAKLHRTGTVGRVADRAVQVHGGSGHMRSVLGGAVLPGLPPAADLRGTSETQKLVIAKHVVSEFTG